MVERVIERCEGKWETGVPLILVLLIAVIRTSDTTSFFRVGVLVLYIAIRSRQTTSFLRDIDGRFVSNGEMIANTIVP